MSAFNITRMMKSVAESLKRSQKFEIKDELNVKKRRVVGHWDIAEQWQWQRFLTVLTATVAI
jgi:hypothetical protein